MTKSQNKRGGWGSGLLLRKDDALYEQPKHNRTCKLKNYSRRFNFPDDIVSFYGSSRHSRKIYGKLQGVLCCSFDVQDSKWSSGIAQFNNVYVHMNLWASDFRDLNVSCSIPRDTPHMLCGLIEANLMMGSVLALYEQNAPLITISNFHFENMASKWWMTRWCLSHSFAANINFITGQCEQLLNAHASLYLQNWNLITLLFLLL